MHIHIFLPGLFDPLQSGIVLCAVLAQGYLWPKLCDKNDIFTDASLQHAAQSNQAFFSGVYDSFKLY